MSRFQASSRVGPSSVPRALDTGAHNSEKRYDRPRVLMHSYHLYTYTIDIQPENRVLISQSFGLAHEVGLAFTSAVRVPVERATGLSTRAHNSEKRYDRPRVLMHFYHLYVNLISLILDSNQIGDQGMIAFSEAIEQRVIGGTQLFSTSNTTRSATWA